MYTNQKLLTNLNTVTNLNTYDEQTKNGKMKLKKAFYVAFSVNSSIHI